LERAPGGRLPADQVPKFFTMLPDMLAYRKIVSFFGVGVAREMLVTMNDVVAADAGLPGTSSLREAKKLPVFQQAFLRQSESFFAWANAGPILRGLEYEEIGQISSTFNIRFRLSGRPNEHDLTFRFDVKDHVLPRRFSIVIGKNGVGKSQTLANIARAALRGTKALTDEHGKRPVLNRLLAFSPTVSSTLPSERIRNPRIWYRRFAMTHSGGARHGQTAAQLIVQLVRSTEGIRERKRLQLFLDAIGAIDDAHELGLRSRNNDGIIRFDELRPGTEQRRLETLGSIDERYEPVRVIDGRPYALSSGEQSFVRFAAIASLHIENGTLVLLDEPETHLHPNFISQFVGVLDSVLEATGSAAIIATHSVYFVREAFEDQVIVLRSDLDRTIIAEPPKLKTFGADVGAISYFVFGEDQPSRLAQKVEDLIAEGSASWAKTLETFKDDLSLELLGEIRARIEPPAPMRRR
jgi:energy-coupling factor transporter ATP-binding protein EcfA2